MGKKVEHKSNVSVDENGLLEGYIEVTHGSLKVGTVQLAKDLTWICDVTGVQLHELIEEEAARNISVRMAVIRDLPEAIEKVKELDGATVKYADIGSWTTKGSKGKRKFADMSGGEIMGKMTPAQLEEFVEKMKADGLM
jgi:hypothetical protein